LRIGVIEIGDTVAIVEFKDDIERPIWFAYEEFAEQVKGKFAKGIFGIGKLFGQTVSSSAKAAEIANAFTQTDLKERIKIFSD